MYFGHTDQQTIFQLRIPVLKDQAGHEVLFPELTPPLTRARHFDDKFIEERRGKTFPARG
jgi:hypothetical protein